MSKNSYKNALEEIKKADTVEAMDRLSDKLRRMFALKRLTQPEFLRLDDKVFSKVVELEEKEYGGYRID